MAVIFVSPPDGSEVLAPDIDWLRELVLHHGAEFWSSGSGQAWLKYPEGPQLLLAFAAGHGFYPEYIDREGQCWISLAEGSEGEKIPVWIGGDPIIVSKRFFVPAELAWAAVEEFCATGARTNRISWVRLSNLDWNFGYWDHPEVKLR
jgi:hypothetical protein